MRSRAYICKNCGGVRRAYDHSHNQSPGFLERHPKARCSGCGEPLLAMSHEQGAAATKITPQERLAWLDSGGFALRGHGKPRWRPATSPQEISDAKEQEKSYLEARRELGSRDNRLINEREDRLADITVDIIRSAISRIEPTRLQRLIGEREHSENRAYDVLLDIVNEDAAALEVVLGTLMSLWRRGYRTIAATIAYDTFLTISGKEFGVDSQLIRPDLIEQWQQFTLELEQDWGSLDTFPLDVDKLYAELDELCKIPDDRSDVVPRVKLRKRDRS